MQHTFVILAYNESDDLEECIKSVINQSVKSNVVIATSTPNDYIIDLASKYSLGVMVNKEKSNKGRDYNFCISTFNTPLLTIAHQDDLYDRNYTREILKNITLDSTLVVPQEKEVILDLNGFTLTSNKDDYVIKNNGILTITDSEFKDRYESNVNYKTEQARLFETAKNEQ